MNNSGKKIDIIYRGIDNRKYAYQEDKALKTNISYYANWELASNLPRGFHEGVPFDKLPYEKTNKMRKRRK